MTVTWRYALTSIAGTSHVAANKGCDDANHCEVVTLPNTDEVLIACVSDGAGSAELSRFGSELAVKVLAENARGWLNAGGDLAKLPRDVVLDWLDNVRDRIGQLVTQDFTHPKDYAATLVFAIVARHCAAFGQLGDGAIVAAVDGDQWSAIFWPQHGDYANQTYFVTDDSASSQMAFEIRSGQHEDVVLFTDGLERVLLDFANQKAHPPAFARMIGPLRRSAGSGEIAGLSAQLGDYLKSPGITSHSDDDLTLLIATCRNASTTPTVG